MATNSQPQKLEAETLVEQLNENGCAIIRGLLHADQCSELVEMYAKESLFRSRIVMAQHNFGRGEYKYFGYPLPHLVAGLRKSLYPPLARIANDWAALFDNETDYPAALDDWLARCHAAGQLRPTPLLLSYREGDYNCLHQDVYGELVFPLQAAVLLSRRGTDFEGGEFVLTEQRPRMQSRAEVVPLEQGDAVVFPVHHRPVRGTRSVYRVNMRHGVSRIRRGNRMTLGIIFHDAK